MPKEIENPLTSGLPAKILILSYIKPETGYSLGKQIYDVKKYPPTSKIYGWCKPLIEQGYLEKSEQGYRTKPDKIVEAIEDTLRERDVALTSHEKRLLTKLLDSEKFRRAVNFVVSEKDLKSELNFVRIICTLLVQTIVPIMYRRRREKEDRGEISEEEFDKLARCEDIELPDIFSDETIVSLFKGIFGKKDVEKFFKEIRRDVQNLANVFVLLELLPNSLLAKLERLDDDLCLMQYMFCYLMIVRK